MAKKKKITKRKNKTINKTYKCPCCGKQVESRTSGGCCIPCWADYKAGI